MNRLIEKYGNIGTVTIGEQEIPIINIPMMSDEKWQELAIENAVHNFTINNGRAPIDVDEAVKWQKGAVHE